MRQIRKSNGIAVILGVDYSHSILHLPVGDNDKKQQDERYFAVKRHIYP